MGDPSELIIRSMHARDYPAIRALWEAAGLPLRSTGRDARGPFLRQLEHYPTTYLVAERAGRIVGVVLGTHDRRKGWINRLAVHPDFRRMGIAKRLLLACEQALHELGIEIVAALIEHGNDTSIAAFESAGYACDVPVHYYRKLARPDI